MRINDLALKQYAKLEECVMKGRLNYKTTKDDEMKERWFILKGNLLFYFRIMSNIPLRIEQEPIGVLVLEECSPKSEPNLLHQASFSITFKLEPRYYFYGTKSECEEWLTAISLANMQTLKTQLLILQAEILRKTGQDPVRKILDGRILQISKSKAIGRSTFVHVSGIQDAIGEPTKKTSSTSLSSRSSQQSSASSFMSLPFQDLPQNPIQRQGLVSASSKTPTLPPSQGSASLLIEPITSSITNVMSPAQSVIVNQPRSNVDLLLEWDNPSDVNSMQNNTGNLFPENSWNLQPNVQPSVKFSNWESFE